MPLNRRHVLTVRLSEGKALPTEFRLFAAGVNATRKGDFLFDEAAAASVMAEYEAHGVELMMDLEHLSVAPLEITGDGRAFNSDAQAWFYLEIRNGELWAVNVKWTPEGKYRLTRKKQRFVSPAFDIDEEGRVISIFNVALTSTPATDNAPALVAASQRKTMEPDENTEGTKGKAASVREAIAAVLAALQDADKALGAGDIDAMFTAIEAAQTSVDAYETAAAALVPGLQDEGAASATDQPPPAEGSDEDKALKAMSSQLAAITGESSIMEILSRVKAFKNSHTQLSAERAKLAAERVALELAERKDLVGDMVRLGAEPPATAYEDKEATKVAEPWASMPIAKLRARVQKLSGGKPISKTGLPTPAQRDTTVITSSDGIQVSDFELNRLRKACDLHKTDFDKAQEKYLSYRRMQFLGAQQKGTATNEMLRMLSSGVSKEGVLLDNYGQRVILAQSPVHPIQEMGASSQRALEEFRLEYNTSLAAQPISWAENIGRMLPSGALKETYPIGFKVAKYREKVAGNAPARTSVSKDITVEKRTFNDAHEVELRRLNKDFAYILQWQENARAMAAARVYLRSHLVVDLLIANPLWIDGKNFFAADHPVHPMDKTIKFRGSASWGNYQGTATPFGADNLSKEKAAFFGVPHPNGEELGVECDLIIVPSMLKELVHNTLKVQDFILAAKASEGGVSNVFGQVKNPHFMSGTEYVRAPELPGTDVTADWYPVSMSAIAKGLVPWVISEDPTEEVKIWDENSDYYKNTDFIKYESIVQVNAVLVYPHGIRKVKGS